MSIFLWRKKRLLGCLNFFRPKTASVFTSMDRAKAEMMRPYLAEALDKVLVSETMRQWEMMVDSIVETLPYEAVVLMDESLEPVCCNRKAVQILSRLYGGKGLQEARIERFSREIRSGLEGARITERESESPVEPPIAVVLPSGEKGEKTWASIIPTENSGKTFYVVGIASVDEEKRIRETLKSLALTRREVDVVLLLSRGLRNHEIGKTLYISEYTVENHLRAIFRKLGVSNRTAAAHRLTKLTRPANPLGFPGVLRTAQ